MEPLIAEAAEVDVAKIDEGQEPAPGDVVVARIGGGVQILKAVKGVPGDRLALKENDDDTFAILVNGVPATNSQGLPYAIGVRGYRMLSLYVRDYKGVIPPGTYLLLGDRTGGTRDSTELGLMSRQDILGKVVKVRPPATGVQR